MRCSARRRRAAATISIARVIFWMFLTEAIRFLTSRWEAMSVRCGGPAYPLGRSSLLQRRILVERLPLLVEFVAEVRRERLDRVVQALLGLIRPVAARDLRAQVGVLG